LPQTGQPKGAEVYPRSGEKSIKNNCRLTLTLLMARLGFANNTHRATTTNNLAIAANLFN
jgi:hypothetical protein